MFWGVTLENGKRYSQVVDMPVCITMASLEPSTSDGSKSVSVMIEHEKSEFLLCTLMHDKIPQQPLDLQFVEGEEVTFFLNGQGIVHLSGYSAEGDDHEMDGSEEGDSEEDTDVEMDDEELEALIKEKDLLDTSMKRKHLIQSPKNAKKLKAFGADNDTDDEDEDDLESEDDSETDDDADLFVKVPMKGKGAQQQTPKKTPGQQVANQKAGGQTPKGGQQTPKGGQQTPKGGQQTPKGGQQTPKGGQQTPKGGQQTPKGGGPQSPKTPVVNGTSPGATTASGKKKNKTKKSKSPNQSPATTDGNVKPQVQQQETPAKETNSGTESKTPVTATLKKGQAQTLPGGVTIEDVTAGNGPVAKTGSVVQVYYKGTLTSGKEFDSQLKGKPFKFRLGKNDVIKGWDLGIQGMKVGGRRKIVVPASHAYGSKAVGTIPANSTLVFDVNLVSVK